MLSRTPFWNGLALCGTKFRVVSWSINLASAAIDALLAQDNSKFRIFLFSFLKFVFESKWIDEKR